MECPHHMGGSTKIRQDACKDIDLIHNINNIVFKIIPIEYNFDYNFDFNFHHRPGGSWRATPNSPLKSGPLTFCRWNNFSFE
jgi:hypothetical protein